MDPHRRQMTGSPVITASSLASTSRPSRNTFTSALRARCFAPAAAAPAPARAPAAAGLALRATSAFLSFLPFVASVFMSASRSSSLKLSASSSSATLAFFCTSNFTGPPLESCASGAMRSPISPTSIIMLSVMLVFVLLLTSMKLLPSDAAKSFASCVSTARREARSLLRPMIDTFTFSHA